MQDTDFCCTYRCTGGMNGEMTFMSVRSLKGEDPVFEYSVQPAFNLAARTGSVPLDDGDVGPFVSMYEEHHVSSWGGLGPATHMALDAPKEEVIFLVRGSSQSIGSELELPRGSEGLIWDIRGMMYALVPEERS